MSRENCKYCEHKKQTCSSVRVQWQDGPEYCPSFKYNHKSKPTVEALQRQLKEAEEDCLRIIDERDTAEDKIREIDIALGGSGEQSSLRDGGDEALKAARDLKVENKRLREVIDNKNKALVYAGRFLNPEDCDREYVREALELK